MDEQIIKPDAEDSNENTKNDEEENKEEVPVTLDEDKQSNDGEDDEKEFEPTVEMMMNEFDDEQTIEEEERLAQEDDQDELSALEKEQDMPIEELLKLYYNKPPEDEATPDQEEQEDPPEDESKVDVNQETSDTEVVTTSRGEKRGNATPPPAKKSKTELAKFYTSVVEGRSLRSSAGAGGDEAEEEESDLDEEEGKDYSWKKTIMIGPSYQASVPSGLSDYDNDTLPYENEDKQLWDPTRLSEDTTLEYLTRSGEAGVAACGGGVNAIPNGNHIRDDEQALFLLLQCGYNIDEALRRRRMSAIPPADTMSLWSEEECRAFETGLRVYGKDFYSIKNQKVGTRAVGELVQFYYLWKKTERHDVFANSFRMEKKKYTLHPGTTDYMERFIDEQEAGRERSTSPNYHSLIYGDPKKNCEGKSDVPVGDKEDDLSTERSTE